MTTTIRHMTFNETERARDYMLEFHGKKVAEFWVYNDNYNDNLAAQEVTNLLGRPVTAAQIRKVRKLAGLNMAPRIKKLDPVAPASIGASLEEKVTGLTMMVNHLSLRLDKQGRRLKEQGERIVSLERQAKRIQPAPALPLSSRYP